MRTRTSVMLLAALLMLLPPATPRAGALPAYQVETFFFNYGSQYHDGSQWLLCGGQQGSMGDTTPDNGGLKLIITTNCDTYEEVYEWYRWEDGGGSCYQGYWQWIPEPLYERWVYC